MSAADKKLWAQIKKQADKIYAKPSAYKSGYIVKKYKELGGKFISSSDTHKGLSRWFAEEWKNQHGKVGYQHANDVYRPTKRVTKNTPKTWSELTPAQIKAAEKEKARTHHVKKF